MDQRRMIPLGIQGETGEPLAPPQSVGEFCRRVLGLGGLWEGQLRAKHPEFPAERATREELRRREPVFRGEVLFQQKNKADAREAGWTYVISENHPRRLEIERGLRRLAEHRWMSGGPHYLDDLPPERWSEWIEERFASEQSHLTPYVLLVGDPTDIPFRFQSMLSAWAYVGRLDFSPWEAGRQGTFSVKALEAYVDKVIENELKEEALWVDRSVQFLAPDKGGDDGSHYCRLFLAQPLIEAARAIRHGNRDAPQSRLKVDALLAEEATLGRFVSALRGANPALVFTVGHGTIFAKSPLETQLKYNGSVVCQRGAEDEKFEDFNFSVKNIPGEQEAFLPGSAFFQFACYGYGTPRTSDFANWYPTRPGLNQRSFVSALPKALLAHPKGPIAYIGHTDLAWIRAFLDEEKRPHAKRRKAFEGTLVDLLGGVPVGMALEAMRRQRILYSAELVRFIDSHRSKGGDFLSEKLFERLARVFILHNDAQNYLLLGDPAARVRIPLDEQARRRSPLAYGGSPSTPRPGIGVQMPIMRGESAGRRSSGRARWDRGVDASMHLWAEAPSALAPGKSDRLRIRASSPELPSGLVAVVAADGAVAELPDKVLRVPAGSSGGSFEAAFEVEGRGPGEGWVGVRFEQRGIQLAAFRFPVAGREGDGRPRRQSAQVEPLGEDQPSPLRLLLLRPGGGSEGWRWIVRSRRAGLDYRSFPAPPPQEASRGLIEGFPEASPRDLESLASRWSGQVLPSRLREALADGAGSHGIHLSAPVHLPWECLRLGGVYLGESGLINDSLAASPSPRLDGDSWLVARPRGGGYDWCRRLEKELGTAGWACASVAVDEDELLSLLLRNPSDALQVICEGLDGDSGGIGLGEEEGVPAVLDSQIPSALLRWQRGRPLFLLMACGGEPSLDRAWPEIASRCGAAASVITRWPVRPRSAQAFTAAFAASLSRGRSLAESASRARRHAREREGADWLSFTVQGDPRAQREPERRK